MISYLKDKDNLLKILLYTSLLLLLYLFVPVLVSFVGFILNIGISKLHFPISLIIAVSILFLYLRKKNNGYKEGIISTLISILILICTLLFSCYFIDYSYDGVNYHLHSVISLYDGWNPLKEVLNTGYYADMNANFFAGKGVWYYSASIAKLIGNFNVTKSYILISSFSALFLLIYTLIKTNILKKMTPMYTFVFALLMIINPVILYQFMTNYTDVYLANLSIILLLVLLLYSNPKTKNNLLLNLMSFISIIIMGNIKATGIFFAFMFTAAFVLMWFIKTIKTKKWKEFFIKILPFALGGISIFIIGFNPYFTNVINGYNMFHPVFGNQKIDLVGANCPETLRGKNTVEKIYLSIMSPVSNYVETELYETKSPFEIKETELSNNAFDIRLGGFGSLFQLIVWISIFAAIIATVMYFINKRKNKDNLDLNNYIYLFFVILIVGIIFPDGWWARYYPLFWLLPFIILIVLLNVCKNTNIVKYFSITLFMIMLFNNSILFYSTYKVYSVENITMKNQLNECSNEKCIVATNVGLFGFTVSRMFEDVNSDIEFEEYLKVNDWQYSSWLISTKVLK